MLQLVYHTNGKIENKAHQCADGFGDEVWKAANLIEPWAFGNTYILYIYINICIYIYIYIYI